MSRPNRVPGTPTVRAFTFVEMLVVIAIIAVLAAVLFPVVASAKSGVRGRDDLQHLGQLVRAESIYAQDANDRFLPVGSPTVDYHWSPARNPNVDASGKPWMGWGLRLAPYCANYEVFKSPFLPKEAKFTGPCAGSTGMAISNSYLLNWMLGADGTHGDPEDLNDKYAWSPDHRRRFDEPVEVSAIRSPANTVAFTLGHAMPPYASDWGCLFVTVQASDYSNQLQSRAFREDGANIAFADGSARAIRYDQMTPAQQGEHPWSVYHILSQHVWMEPTMPASSMGFQNTDDEGRPVGDL